MGDPGGHEDPVSGTPGSVGPDSPETSGVPAPGEVRGRKGQTIKGFTCDYVYRVRPTQPKNNGQINKKGETKIEEKDGRFNHVAPLKC